MENLLKVYNDVLLNSQKLESFPICKIQKNQWARGSHWSNGYVIGVILLSEKLGTIKNADRISYAIKLLGNHKETDKFQDVGFISLYSECLAYEKGFNLEENITDSINYLKSCLTRKGNLFVNWMDGEVVSVDQFMNSMFFGWHALTFKDLESLEIHERIIENSIELLVQDNIVYEYSLEDGRHYNKNAENTGSTWFRSDAWAIVGISYYLFIRKECKKSICKESINLLDKLLKKYIYIHNKLGFFPGIYSNDLSEKNNLLDSSAEAAIFCALNFMERRNVSNLNSISQLRNILKMKVNENLFKNGNILNSSAYPLRLIDQKNMSSVWGDYYGLRAKKEMSYGKNSGGINII
ncbi:hypothetical protein [Pantoea ananatis]|uniref:hypothetical protein n=1 Tax=Pantoea ananas TaxID=553 RepID=UPI0002E2F466|nr:hypothetical protein [Pantoea ananatis]